MFRTKDMYTVWDKLARNCIPCLGQSRPVAKIFCGRVRSYEETDQTRPEAQVSRDRGEEFHKKNGERANLHD